MVYEVNEGCSFRLSAVLKDEAGNLLGSGSINTLVATLYDKAQNLIINLRDHQNILNANGGTLDAQGNFVFLGSAADAPIANASIVGSEAHILLVEWTYQSGTKSGKQQFEIAVKNLNLVAGAGLLSLPTMAPLGIILTVNPALDNDATIHHNTLPVTPVITYTVAGFSIRLTFPTGHGLDLNKFKMRSYAIDNAIDDLGYCTRFVNAGSNFILLQPQTRESEPLAVSNVVNASTFFEVIYLP